MSRRAEPGCPPRGADRLLRRALADDAYEVVVGDLEETYRSHVRPRRGRLLADLWFWTATFRALADVRRARRQLSPLSPPGRRPSMIDLLSDARFALRTLRRAPGLMLAVTLTLALGVGANVAIFNVVYGTLVRRLPFPDADRLVFLNETNAERHWTAANVAVANFLDWRERATGFEDMTIHGWRSGMALTGGDRPEWILGTSVFHNFFDVIGVAPLLGRTFTEEETWGAGERPVIISYGLWQRRFAGDPDVVGKTIRLDDRERVIVGVMPDGFSYPGEGIDVWSAFGWDPAVQSQGWFRRAHWVRGLGRLRAGVSMEEAYRELDRIAADLEAEHEEDRGMRVHVRSLQDAIVGDTRRPLLVLLGAVGAVLLIACANIANLLLARSADRAREVSIRAALGAGRSRIVRQLMTESLLLAVVGGAAGLAVAYWLTGFLLHLGEGVVPRPEAVAFGGPSLLFGLTATLGTGMIFGLVPAWHAAKVGTRGALRDGGRSASPGRAISHARSALVVAEVAVALVLVSAAGLMLRSASRLAAVDPGFEPANLLAATIELPSARYPETADIEGFLDRLDARLTARPGIRSVALADSLPVEGANWTSDFWIEGRPIGGDQPVVEFNRHLVSGDYFQTMGVPLLAGRTFDEHDTADTTPVAVINEVMARDAFAGENPIGARITDTTAHDEDDWYTIVGVVGAEKVEGLDSREWPEMLFPLTQQPSRFVYVLIRYEPGSGRPDAVFQQEVAALDPDLPVISSRTFEEILSATMGTERLLTLLLGAFAAMALGLASVGVAGVISWSVVRRTREIGVRVALGASAHQVVGMVVRQGMVLVGVGIVIGLALALATARALGSLLYETSPVDPSTLLAVVLVLTATAAAAIWIPARRAASVDPVRSLQAD